jgi:hypothetical protein
MDCHVDFPPMNTEYNITAPTRYAGSPFYIRGWSAGWSNTLNSKRGDCRGISSANARISLTRDKIDQRTSLHRPSKAVFPYYIIEIQAILDFHVDRFTQLVTLSLTGLCVHRYTTPMFHAAFAAPGSLCAAACRCNSHIETSQPTHQSSPET